MINWEYNTDTQILEVYYIGNIIQEEYDNYIFFLKNSKELPRNLKILTDASNAIYSYKMINFNQVLNEIRILLRSYKCVKNAFLHAKPNETAISMIMENRLKIDNYQQKIFSTNKAALDWLLIT